MDYRDALEACLEAIRAGEDRERAVAAYPEHAAQLREDVALTDSVRAYSTRIAQPPEGAAARARLRMNNELVTQCNQRASTAKAPSRAFWRMPLVQGLALGIVVLMAVGFLALSGVVGGAQTANAQTIEGIVVETHPDGIVVQTEEGLKTVSLDPTSSISDENGGAVDAKSLMAGQVIQVKAKKLPKGLLRAIAVQKRPFSALAAWCRLHPVRCQEVEPKLPAGALACEASAGPCLLPTSSAGAPSSGDQGRLRDLADRCQRNGGAPCEELRTFCRNNPGVCIILTGWLRTVLDLPDDVRQRIQIQSQRCQNGSILDCRELRLLCERTNQSCPALTPNRQSKATPRRPF